MTDDAPITDPTAEQPPADAPPQPDPLRSVYTATLGDILKQTGISLAVSTYQAGKVILVRYDPETDTVNTHFRAFAKPMGIAADAARLAVGGTNTVWYYRNMPAVARKLEPADKHDAAYLPRRVHVTGDIDIHEMAWAADGELWLVNTRFGCLCTLDADHSFHPRWRPPHLSALAPEDRCHLNGLAMLDGRPQFVTMLGETDTAGGWRENKARGGLLMEVPTRRALLARPVDAPLAALVQQPAVVPGVGRGQSGVGQRARRQLANGGLAARLHPRAGLLRAAGLHRPIAGARERHV